MYLAPLSSDATLHWSRHRHEAGQVTGKSGQVTGKQTGTRTRSRHRDVTHIADLTHSACRLYSLSQRPTRTRRHYPRVPRRDPPAET
eukprot:858710-Rhodomonas_salina.1